jgi:F-type H+-transporting ATPase subunit b
MMQKIVTGLSAFMLASPALAAAARGEGSKVSPFTGDLGNMIWTLVIFLVVIFVLGRFAWGPLLNLLQKREEFIRESLEQAKRDREHAEANRKAIDEKLEATRGEATAIVEEARRDAEVVKRKIEETARKEAEALLQRSRREIRVATDTAVRELYDLTGKLATDVATRIIRKEIDAAQHERLIGDSIEQLSKVRED